MWRFFDPEQALKLRVQFEPRGLFWLARHRAHLPMQFGSDIFDVALKIWRRDGHISFKKTELLYTDEALAAELREQPGRIPLPGYVKLRERIYACVPELQDPPSIKACYLVAATLFLLASIVSWLFPIPLLGQYVLQPLLELTAHITGLGDWTVLAAGGLHLLSWPISF